jgi:GNAT superfamily N-acetyltransferase
MTGSFYNVVINSGGQPLDGATARSAYRLVKRSGATPGSQVQPAPASEGAPAAVLTPRAHIRRARPEDAATIEALIRTVAAESPVYREMPIDDRKLKSFIAMAIRSHEHAVLLHEGATGIDGLFIGVLVQQFFTVEFTAMDILFYVRPERRGSRAAVRLWRAYKDWAQAQGAKAIKVGAMTEIEPARTAKFYRGMGLREIGGIFHARIG